MAAKSPFLTATRRLGALVAAAIIAPKQKRASVSGDVPDDEQYPHS
jgi:hypothetical protein